MFVGVLCAFDCFEAGLSVTNTEKEVGRCAAWFAVIPQLTKGE